MRRKRKYRGDIPASVAELIRSLCADYERRENAIKFSAITGPVLARYVELNAAIDTAMCGVEAGIREDLLADIGSGRGYEASALCMVMAKNTYYKRKEKVIKDIARELALI